MLNKIWKNFKLRTAIAVLGTVTLGMGISSVIAESTGDLQKFYVDSAGRVTINGYFNDDAQTDSTLLLTNTGDMSVVEQAPNDCIMYIDQEKLGNNGVFLYSFPLNEKFSGSDYVLKVGGGETILKEEGTLRTIPSGIQGVPDGAIKVGNDVYYSLNCASYTPDNVSASIERGGNSVYYKIDGKWFDMLDPKATDGSYFNGSENAVADEVWDAWEIDNFYKN